MTTDDELYLKAVNLVIDMQRVSVPAIQRHAHIGFSQAMGYVEEMQAMGIVSAADAAGRRVVLVQDEPPFGSGTVPLSEASGSPGRSASAEKNASNRSGEAPHAD